MRILKQLLTFGVAALAYVQVSDHESSLKSDTTFATSKGRSILQSLTYEPVPSYGIRSAEPIHAVCISVLAGC